MKIDFSFTEIGKIRVFKADCWIGFWALFLSAALRGSMAVLVFFFFLWVEIGRPLVAQNSVPPKKGNAHTFRLALSGQGSFSKNWQGQWQSLNIWMLNAQMESTLFWRSGRWSFQVPTVLEGQAAWIPDSLYSVINDRLVVGSRLGWRIAGQDSLPHSLMLEYGQRLETRWLPKTWLQKLRSFSKGQNPESDYNAEPYFLNPGIVFLSFGLTCRLWNNLRLHAGLAGAKLNFVLNRYSGTAADAEVVWGIEPMGANPRLQWGWNAEVHWEKKGKRGESYLLQAYFFSPPDQLQSWSGRGKAELNFPLYKEFSMGWHAQWSYEPSQFSGHQWQQSIFLRVGIIAGP
jgi:hypothetical protein